MINMATVELSKLEMNICRMVAEQRNQYGENKGYYTNSKDKPLNHFVGAVGEYAVCKYFGWFWDYSIGSIHKNDIPGLKYPVDVKTRNRDKHGTCLVQYKEGAKEYYKKHSYFFIFCDFTGTAVDIWGAMNCYKFFQKAEIKTYVPENGPVYSMDRSHLEQLQKNPVRNFLQTGLLNVTPPIMSG